MDLNSIINYPEMLLLALAPVFFVCIFLEWYLGDKRQKLPLSARYKKAEVFCNISLAGMHQLTDILAGLLIAKIYLAVFGWKSNFTPGSKWRSPLIHKTFSVAPVSFTPAARFKPKTPCSTCALIDAQRQLVSRRI